MLIKELQGLKYPDDYVIRFFFKEGLDRKKGRVLELGCGNGNNLMMFYQYGWDVTGVDLDKASIRQAEDNFSKCRQGYGLKNKYIFFVKDMVDFAASQKKSSWDVVMIPGSLDYLEYSRILKLMELISANKLVKAESFIFTRVRTPQDYRCAKGDRYSAKTFRLNFEETSEKGCLMTFLNESELTDIFEKNFKFKHKRLFRCNFDNWQGSRLISNYNIIFWGMVK